jgi:ATP-dependent DNA ligase
MFLDGVDLRELPLTERKKRLKAILPKHKLVAFSRHRLTSGTKFFGEAERKGLEGIMAKRADSKYEAAGGRHRRLHGSKAHEAILWRSHTGTARGQRLALHRPRGHRLQP